MKILFGLLGVFARWVRFVAVLWLLLLGAMWLLGKGCEPALQDIGQHGLKHKIEKLWYGTDSIPAKSP